MRYGKPSLVWLVDSREQLAYALGQPVRREFAAARSEVRGLGEGDYSVCFDARDGAGAPLDIRIERKSLGDYYGICGYGRERFERELERLGAYQAPYGYAAVVIEATQRQVLAGYQRSRISGRAALASALSWSVDYGVHFHFAGDRRMGQAVTQRLLEEFAAKILREWKAREKRDGAAVSGT